MLESFYFGPDFENELMIKRNFFIIIVGLILNFSCGSDEKKVPQMEMKRTIKAEKKENDHPGKILYFQFCLACHMQNGEGVPSLYPPLIQTDYVLGDKKRLIKTVIHGMEGPIEVKGSKYNNIMAKLDYLRDEQIADVLSYIRSNFGNNADPVSVEEVRIARREGPPK